MADNLEPTPSKKKKILCEIQRFVVESFALCTVCGSDFSVAHGEENDISRHKDISKHEKYVDAAQRQRKLTDLSASSVTVNLDQKVVEVKLFFFWFSG